MSSLVGFFIRFLARKAGEFCIRVGGSAASVYQKMRRLMGGGVGDAIDYELGKGERKLEERLTKKMEDLLEIAKKKKKEAEVKEAEAGEAEVIINISGDVIIENTDSGGAADDSGNTNVIQSNFQSALWGFESPFW